MSTTQSITRAEAQRICNLLGVYMAMSKYGIWSAFRNKPLWLVTGDVMFWKCLMGSWELDFVISDYDGTAANSLISPEGMA